MNTNFISLPSPSPSPLPSSSLLSSALLLPPAKYHERFCKRFCIGLTGGIASGKSTAASIFAKLGAVIIDTDVIAHQLTAGSNCATGIGAAMPAILSAFGTHFANHDGSLNRAMMRAQVFSNPVERLRLEAIMHPLINLQTRLLGNSIAGDYVVFVVPLLVENSYWRKQVDRFTVVDCTVKLQKQRLLQREGLTSEQAEQILAAQATRPQRLACADDILNNDGVYTNLVAQIEKLHQQYVLQLLPTK